MVKKKRFSLVIFMKNNFTQRTSIVLGVDNVDKLSQKSIVICGIGGVGSYALEALARVGIGNIQIIDQDTVDVTNINRQLIALHSTIGKSKVEIAKNRLLDINPNLKIRIIEEKITPENIHQLIDFKTVDYVIDAIDDINAKIALINKAYKTQTKCISCMGMGNKVNPLDIKVDDVFKTTVCPLARIMRKKLKELEIPELKVVYSTEMQNKKEKQESTNNILGSVSFVPSVAGLVIASEVVKDLISDKK